MNLFLKDEVKKVAERMKEFYDGSLSLLHISRNFDSGKMVFLSPSGNSKDEKNYSNQIENSVVISSRSMSDVQHLTQKCICLKILNFRDVGQMNISEV